MTNPKKLRRPNPKNEDDLTQKMKSFLLLLLLFFSRQGGLVTTVQTSLVVSTPLQVYTQNCKSVQYYIVTAQRSKLY